MKVEVMGIEFLNNEDGTHKSCVYHLAEWIDNGDGCKYLGRVYTRNGFDGINIGDTVVPEFASSRNGWYIKSLRKGE